MVSVNSARTKAQVSAAKAAFGHVRMQAQHYYDSANTFGTGTVSVTTAGSYSGTAGTVWADSKIRAQLLELRKNMKGTLSGRSIGEVWALTGQLHTTSGNQYFCMDNSGSTKVKTTTFSITSANCI